MKPAAPVTRTRMEEQCATRPNNLLPPGTSAGAERQRERRVVTGRWLRPPIAWHAYRWRGGGPVDDRPHRPAGPPGPDQPPRRPYRRQPVPPRQWPIQPPGHDQPPRHDQAPPHDGFLRAGDVRDLRRSLNQ